MSSFAEPVVSTRKENSHGRQSPHGILAGRLADFDLPEVWRSIGIYGRRTIDTGYLDVVEKFLNAREPLTEAERRYCEAEGVPLEDFIRKLPKL